MSRTAVMLIGASLGLVGCGRPGEQSARTDDEASTLAPVASKACEIVTRADVERNLGRIVDIKGHANEPATCVYHYAAARSGGKGMLDVVLHASGIARIKRNTTYSIEPAHEIGGDAFWGGYASLYAGKGDKTVVFTLSDADMNKAETRTKVVELAKQSLDRL